jgi:arginine N-succinyltransferase
MEPQFVIRSVREDDLDALFRLAEMVYFINLPADEAILREKIRVSVDSFCGDIEDKFAREYIFVLERVDEEEKREIVGTSMILARHGTPDEPHMYFELREIQKYSETIHSGFIHKVMHLRFDYDGPTEIGGLVVHPNYRGFPGKLGRQLSFARFAFIKMRRRCFKNHVLSELMPPLTEDGESILWEALGRRFTNLSYPEADRLSRRNKEFVTSLFPKGDIYTCLLPGEVRDAIGKVGEATEPVKHMLEKIGFRWRQHIDPFDGGPHYWADTDRITVVASTRKAKVSRKEPRKDDEGVTALVSSFDRKDFRCVQVPATVSRGLVSLSRRTQELLAVGPGDAVYVTPLD